MPGEVEMIGCRREFPERSYEHCGKPAGYIVWGKLFSKGALGPRCRGCLEDQCGRHAPTDPAYAIYRLPDFDLIRSQERQRVREERRKRFAYREGEDPLGLQEAQEALEGLYDGADLHDPNCGIPHPADPDQGSRGCTCGVGAVRERFSEAVAESLDMARVSVLADEALAVIADRLESYGWLVVGERRDEALADLRRAVSVALDSLEDGDG